MERFLEEKQIYQNMELYGIFPSPLAISSSSLSLKSTKSWGLYGHEKSKIELG